MLPAQSCLFKRRACLPERAFVFVSKKIIPLCLCHFPDSSLTAAAKRQNTRQAKQLRDASTIIGCRQHCDYSLILSLSLIFSFAAYFFLHRHAILRTNQRRKKCNKHLHSAHLDQVLHHNGSWRLNTSLFRSNTRDPPQDALHELPQNSEFLPFIVCIKFWIVSREAHC